MQKVTILGARLSSNPETKTVQNTQGINGIVNATVNAKQFYVVDALLMKGLTPVVKSQLVWADENGKFAVSCEDFDKYNKGKELNGQLTRFSDVPEYEVDGKKFTHVELLVMEGQDEAAIVGNFIKRQTGSTGGGNGSDAPKIGLNTSGVGNQQTGPKEKAEEKK